MRVLTIDLGSHTIKLCECEVRKRQLQVLRAVQVPVPDASRVLSEQMPQVASVVTKAISEHRMRYDRLVVGVPATMCSFRFLELPFVSRKRIDQVLTLEMEDQVPFSAEEMIVDYQVVGGMPKKTSELLAVMIPNVHYDNFIAAFTDLGLESDVVMPDVVGLALFYEFAVPSSATPFVAIDIGYRHSTMAIIKDQKMVYLRSIPFGYVSFLHRIQEKTNYTSQDVEALVSQHDALSASEQQQYHPILDDALSQLVVEVNQTLVAYRAKSKDVINEMFVSGGLGGLGYVIPTLEGEFACSVRSVASLSGKIQTTESINLVTYATAIGYGTRYCMEDPQAYLNFRRKETKAHKILEAAEKYFETPSARRALRAAMILVLVFVPYFVAKSVLVDMHYDKSTSQMDALLGKVVKGNIARKKRLEYIQKPDLLLDFLERDIQKDGKLLEVLAQKYYVVSDFWHALTKSIPKDVVMDIEVFESSQEEARIVFATVSGDWQGAVKNLRAIPYVRKVDVQPLGNQKLQMIFALGEGSSASEVKK